MKKRHSEGLPDAGRTGGRSSEASAGETLRQRLTHFVEAPAQHKAASLARAPHFSGKLAHEPPDGATVAVSQRRLLTQPDMSLFTWFRPFPFGSSNRVAIIEKH